MTQRSKLFRCNAPALSPASTTLWLVHAHRRCRMLDQLGGGPPWPRRKFATAVWTDTAEFRFHTARTKCALEGTDSRLGRVRRQIAVAAFAVRAELQHLVTSFLSGQYSLDSVNAQRCGHCGQCCQFCQALASYARQAKGQSRIRVRAWRSGHATLRPVAGDARTRHRTFAHGP